MEQELRCSVCHDFFRDPVTLNCTHHVCMVHAGTVAAHERLTCPVCQDVTLVPAGGLVVEKNLQVIVDMFEEQHGGASGSASQPESPTRSGICGYCEEQVATFRCEQCAGVLCAECVKTTHAKGFFKSHTIIELTTDDLSGNDRCFDAAGKMMCHEHQEEKLTFYCLDCRKSVCSHCLILGAHKGHQQTPMDIAFESGKETLCAWEVSLAQRVQSADELLDQLRAAEDGVSRGAESQRSLINDELDYLRDLVETKRQQLLSKSGLEERQKRAQLQAQMDRAVATKSETQALTSRSQGLLGQSSGHAFLAVVLPLLQDMKMCASQNMDAAPTVACTFRPLTTDPQVRSLGDLDLGHPRGTPQAQPQVATISHNVSMVSQTQSSYTTQSGYTQQSAGNATMAYLPQQSVSMHHQQLPYAYRVPS